MENNNQSSDNGNGRSVASRGNNSNPDFTAIIDEMIAKVREILNDFEQVVQEAFNLFDMLRELFMEIKDLFSMRSGQNKTESANA